MSEKNAAMNKRPHGAQPNRPKKRGVATGMVVLLMVLSLVIGSLAGFFIGRRTDPVSETELKRTLEAKNRQLETAEKQIRDDINQAALRGFDLDIDYEFSTDSAGWDVLVEKRENEDPALLTNDGDQQWPDPGSLDEANAQSLADLSGLPLDQSDFWDEPGIANAPIGEFGEDDGDILQNMLSDSTQPVVVATYTYDGETRELMSPEVIEEYNDQLTTLLFGGGSEEDVSSSLLLSVMEVQISEKLIEAEAEKLGLNELTDQDLKDIDAEARQIFDEQMTIYADFVKQPGMTDEEIEAATAEYIKSETGNTLESITQTLKETWWLDKYYDHIVKDVTVTEEEIQAHYDEVLADQKADYDQYADDFMFAHINGDAILYVPQGFRAVRDILIPFDSPEDSDLAGELLEQLSLLDPEKDAEEIARLQAQLDELFAPLEATADEAVQQLAEGESFEDMMDKYGTSDMLQDERLRKEGYYINEDAYINSEEFVEGSMMLEQPGQVSAPLRSDLGVHLVQYIADVPAGEVPLAEVRDIIAQEALELKQSKLFQEHRDELVKAADPQYYPERLQ